MGLWKIHFVAYKSFLRVFDVQLPIFLYIMEGLMCKEIKFSGIYLYENFNEKHINQITLMDQFGYLLANLIGFY